MKRRKPKSRMNLNAAFWVPVATQDHQRCLMIDKHGLSCLSIFLFILQKSVLARSLKVRISDGQISRYAGVSIKTVARCRPLMRDAGLIDFKERTAEDIQARRPYLYSVLASVIFFAGKASGNGDAIPPSSPYSHDGDIDLDTATMTDVSIPLDTGGNTSKDGGAVGVIPLEADATRPADDQANSELSEEDRRAFPWLT